MKLLVFQASVNDRSFMNHLKHFEDKYHLNEILNCQNIADLRTKLIRPGQRPDIVCPVRCK